MGSKEMRFQVDVKEAGLLADSVVSKIMKKTHNNPAETLAVLKMAMAIFEAYLKDQGIKFDAKEFDAYVSEFIKGFEERLLRDD